MTRALIAALAAVLAIGSTVGTADAIAPGEPAVNVQAPAFDGRVMVRMTPYEASALRGESLRGLARMRTASTALRILSATYEVKAAEPALEDRDLFPEARAVGLDRWFEIEVDPAPGYDAVAARLRGLPGVEMVEPALLQYTLDVAPNDSLFAKNWGHGNTGTFPAYNLATGLHDGPDVGTVGFDANVQGGWGAPSGYGTSSTIVAILDSGVDPTHPDLNQVAGYDFVYDKAAVADTLGHGTGCAGIAAGIANNTRGVAGVGGGCRIMPLRLFSATKSTTVQDFLDAVAFAVNNGADVLSMSFEITRFQLMADALTAADAAGVVLLGSTGNSNGSVMPFPANHPKVIAIGAANPCGGRKRSSNLVGQLNPGVSADSLGVSCDNEVWWGSSWGAAAINDSAAVDVIAPTILPSTDIQGAAGSGPAGYTDYAMNGTSAATPYAAGVVALVRSQHPTWTASQVRTRLFQSAIDVSDAQTPVGWDKYTGYGLVNAGLPDLVPYALAGWSSAIVPRPAPDATFGSVPAPTTLNGDVNSYLNVGVANLGESRSGSDLLGLYVDGVEAGGGVAYDLGVNVGAALQNVAWTVRGGRHVVGTVVNKNNDIDESNETNNRDAHQWSWVPAAVTPSINTVVARAVPPNRNAGRADVPVSETTYDNVDAVRMVGPSSSNGYWLIGLHGSDNATDLDLALNQPINSATANFTPQTQMITSQLGAGKTDWGIFFLQSNPTSLVDAASVLVAGTGGSRFESRLSDEIASGFTGTTSTITGVAFGSDMMVAVHALVVSGAGGGAISLELNSSAPLHLAIYDPGPIYSNRAGAKQLSTQLGWVQGLTRNMPNGNYAIVVYRDRSDGTAPLTYTITVRRPTPELMASTAGGLIYEPAGVFKDGVGNQTTLPTVLDGNVNNTRFYYGYSNVGPTAATGFSTRELLDGAEVLTWTPGTVNAGASAFWVSTLRTVPGGRHTMGFSNDITNAIDEFDEFDNDWGVSMVWSPLPLTMEVPVTRPAPPNPTGGWAQMPSSAARYYNADGLTTPTLFSDGTVGDNNFFALAPRVATDDVDLSLFNPTSFAPGFGFTAPSGTSQLPAGRVDYLGFDGHGASAIDLGVISGGAATGNVVVHGTRSNRLASENGTFGPFSLGPDKLVACFDVFLSGIPRQIRLLNLSGNANLDLHVYPRNEDDPVYMLPADAQSAELNGNGVDEVLQYTGSGFPAIVVTKRGTGDIAKNVTFSIQIGASTVGTGDELSLPGIVRLAPVRPNPVQGLASIVYDLPRACAINLAAYDVAGRHVATLASGMQPAGSHTVSWTPGARLASGVYLVRLEADGVESVRRVVVTK